MPIDVLMPQLSPTMTEGRLANWTVAAGDSVSAGDIIAEVETDKATMEVEATDDGVIHQLIGKPGEDIKVGVPIAVLKEDGEEVPADYQPTAMVKEEAKVEESAPVADSASTAAPTTSAPSSVPVAMAAPLPTPVANTGGETVAVSGDVKASPLAKRLAEQKGVNLAGVNGSGPYGRIVKADVEKAMLGGTGAIVRKADEEIQLTPMRKAIAARLTQSKQWVPHFYLNLSIDMSAALDARAQINATAPKDASGKPAFKVSVNDMIVKACALALKKNPDANAAWAETSVIRYGNVDISVAVAIEGGLITPIVPNADQKPLIQLSQEIKALVKQAHAGTLKPEQFQGGSFSVSNLGMYGIKNFQAIVNPPQAAIAACGATEKRVVADESGEMYTSDMMDITISVDHRVIDGALGAELLKDIQFYLENPVAMLV